MEKKTTGKLQDILTKADSDESLQTFLLQDEMLNSNMTFIDYFFSLPEVQAKERGEIVRRSLIERTYCYQILNGHRPHPGRDKIIALCRAAECTLLETRRALRIAKEADLYVKNKRDVIISFAINRNFSVRRTNELLEENGEEILK